MAPVAQSHRPGRARGFVALGLVVPFHIGPQIPFPGVSPGRPVVRDLVGGKEQSGDGVDQSRLA